MCAGSRSLPLTLPLQGTTSASGCGCRSLAAGGAVCGHGSPQACPNLIPCLRHPVSVGINRGRKRLDIQDGAGCHESFLRTRRLRGGGVGARQEPQEKAHACLQRAPAMCPWLRFPSWCKLALPKRRRLAPPLQASQCISEIGLQQKFINSYQCHWPEKIKIEERRVSYAMSPVAVCKGNICFIDFAVWNGNL